VGPHISILSFANRHGQNDSRRRSLDVHNIENRSAVYDRIQLLESFEAWIEFSFPGERAAECKTRIAKSKRWLEAVIF
jgi:hypothetical protein